MVPADACEPESQPLKAASQQPRRPPSSAEHDDALTSASAGRRLIRGSALRIAGNIAGVLAGIGTAALLLRHLGVAESGRYVTVMSLVAVGGTIADAGLNVTGSRELALRSPAERSTLVADFVGLRLLITPPALLLMVLFALIVGYPARMVLGTALAGAGLFIATTADAVLLRLVVELRNGGPAFVEFLRQAITLAGAALLVAIGAHLAPFFAIQIVVGIVIVLITPLLAGSRRFVKPRFDRQAQRALLTQSLPVAAAFVLGQLYFRFVVVLMSLISTPHQTGYFGGSLRAMEALIYVPILIAGTALPLLTAVARDDLTRLRQVIAGLNQSAMVAGVLLVIVMIRAAEPIMQIIGGAHFDPSGRVLRIQVVAIVFVALYQIWSAGLIALSRQRELLLTNVLGVLSLAVFAVVLVPPLGAEGGAAASVAADAVLACLIYWRLHAYVGSLAPQVGFLVKLGIAALPACAVLLTPGLPGLAVAALAGCVFLGAAQLLGILPPQLRAAFRRSAAQADARAGVEGDA